MLTEIFKVVPFHFSYVYAFFFPVLLKNFQRHYIQKDIPVSLFMRYPVDSKTSLVGNEQERSSSSQTQTFLRFLLKRKKEDGKKEADREQVGDKRGAREMKREEKKEKKEKESCPGSGSIHLVSDICFFIAT